MTITVHSKSQHLAAVAEADELGMRLAFVIAACPGVWTLEFRPVESFSDWSGQ